MKTPHRKTAARRASGLIFRRQMRPSGSRGFAVIVRDLSLSGVACEALTAMSPGTRVWLTLPGLSALQAKIVWNDGMMVGCAFDTLLNPAVMQNILAGFPAKGS